MIDLTLECIEIEHYLIVSSLIFLIGIAGMFMNRRHVLGIIMSMELILLAVVIAFVSFSVYLHDIQGQIIALFILTIAAAETAIGLAMLVLYYRRHRTIDVDDMSRLQG